MIAVLVIDMQNAFFEDPALAVRRDERNLGVDTVVLSGVSTHSCVGQTAADAFAHSFRVVYAADASGTEDPVAADAVLAVL